jgi:hypothetical protein
MYIKASQLKFCHYSVTKQQVIFLFINTYASWEHLLKKNLSLRCSQDVLMLQSLLQPPSLPVQVTSRLVAPLIPAFHNLQNQDLHIQ